MYAELLVFSKRHSELNKIMKPRKKEDKSKFLMAPMPGLLVSYLLMKGCCWRGTALSCYWGNENGKYYKIRKKSNRKKS